MAQDMVADKNILNSEGFLSNLCARQCGKSEKRGSLGEGCKFTHIFLKYNEVRVINFWKEFTTDFVTFFKTFCGFRFDHEISIRITILRLSAQVTN